ncbi:hypothetical protein C7J99_20925 [Brevibacillus brevis]|nr:hypothetical protein C7J99_20925 [Brevibacillus brevis]GEC90699.1 hypothetical protein BBR01nite_30300 [Brevibacillus brevis]
MKFFWRFLYSLSFAFGFIGLLAIAIDLIVFRQHTFTQAETVEFICLIALAYLIKRFIYPKFV